MVLAQQQVEPISNNLAQYGAVGVLALVGLIGVWILWKRIDRIYEAESQRHDRLYETERQRADRLEAQLISLNGLISSELSGHLVRATEAMREVTQMLRNRGDQ
ncbi:hypothetical protein [Nocardia sp. NPDC057030]|uniref:hypothetical protein n=1 Tax=unclassified Nocardia TaxID=2637762 RepID=UPI003636433F